MKYKMTKNKCFEGVEAMSRENAFRFMLAIGKDEKIKSAYDAVLNKYQGMDLSDDELDGILEKISQLAEKFGFDFTPEDLKELNKKTEGKLSEEELSEVTGGRGQFTLQRSFLWWESTNTCSCDYAKDDATFANYYVQNFTNCPYYEWRGYGLSTHQCRCCSHFHCS